MEDEPVINEMLLYNYFPQLAECLALTEFCLSINLDRDLEKIRQTIVKVKKQVVVNLYRNGEFLETLRLQHKVENGKTIEVHIVPHNLENSSSYYANSLHDLLVEILDRDLLKLQNILIDFLSRTEKEKFLLIYDVDPARVQEIKEKLADRIFSNEQLFWIGMLQASSIDNFAGYFIDEAVNYTDLEITFKIKKGAIAGVVKQLDFDHLQNSSCLSALQDLFKTLNLDSAEYNKYAVLKIDFTEHFRRLFNGLKIGQNFLFKTGFLSIYQKKRLKNKLNFKI